jgi:hypothetical protein
MFIETILAFLRAMKDLLSAYDSYILKPTKENRETLITHFHNLENAGDKLSLQMAKAQDQLEKGDITLLRKQFAEFDSPLDKLFFDVYEKGKLVIQDIEVNRLVELRDVAEKLSEKGRKVYELWNEIRKLILEENPRYFRRFFSYVCKEIQEFVIESKQAIVFSINSIDKKVIDPMVEEEIPHPVILMPVPTLPNSKGYPPHIEGKNKVIL